ncbi:MAG TPA: hypothetical protein VJB66_03590 [Candidatus Nanoarchaeia archaeon]|nr:hypothetical protein [Candidatus Nanoarchaeia archaeon]
MAQKLLVVNALKVKYKGVFKIEDLFRVLRECITARGYSYHEKRFEERVTEKGKDLFIELRPLKVKTAWTSLTMFLRIQMTNIREVHLEVDKITTTFQEGDLLITLDGWVTYGTRQRWGNKPVFYFIKSVFNKYVYQFPIERNLSGEVASDTSYLYNQLKAHLNLYQYKVKGAMPSVQTPSHSL